METLFRNHFVLDDSPVTRTVVESFLAALPPTLVGLNLALLFGDGLGDPALSRFLAARRSGPLQKVEVVQATGMGGTEPLVVRQVRKKGREGEANVPEAWQWMQFSTR
ncbi:hypothetical protein JCM6882_009007 [Rhodosporidiobolus microsporus]